MTIYVLLCTACFYFSIWFPVPHSLNWTNPAGYLVAVGIVCCGSSVSLYRNESTALTDSHMFLCSTCTSQMKSPKRVFVVTVGTVQDCQRCWGLVAWLRTDRLFCFGLRCLSSFCSVLPHSPISLILQLLSDSAAARRIGKKAVQVARLQLNLMRNLSEPRADCCTSEYFSRAARWFCLRYKQLNSFHSLVCVMLKDSDWFLLAIHDWIRAYGMRLRKKVNAPSGQRASSPLTNWCVRCVARRRRIFSQAFRCCRPWSVGLAPRAIPLLGVSATEAAVLSSCAEAAHLGAR